LEVFRQNRRNRRVGIGRRQLYPDEREDERLSAGPHSDCVWGTDSGGNGMALEIPMLAQDGFVDNGLREGN
jgi:hypothetical protein